jgi:hypothetical protein
MVAEVFGGLSAIKTAFDIAKGLKDIDDAARRNAAVIELQEKILTAQQAQAVLVETVGSLEKEVAQLKAWEADKQRYELKALAPGLVAFALKPTMSNGEPMHYICANCCAAGKKSYLQQHISGPYYDQFKCRGCGDEIPINKGTPPSRSYDDESNYF